MAEYPKWIETKNEVAKTKDNKSIYERVLVQNEKEEAKVLGKVEEKVEPSKEDGKKNWPK